MASECCHNCLYAWWDLCQAMQAFTSGFPNRPACANHPDSLGRMRPVVIGGICRNYRPKPADPAKGAERIPLGDGYYAYVDAADYEWLSQWNWHLINGYAGRWEKGKQVLMHRQIMQPPKGMKVDHVRRNKLDNMRDNLRVCTQQENILNQYPKGDSASGSKGSGTASTARARSGTRNPHRRTRTSTSAPSTTKRTPPVPTTVRRSSISANSPTRTSPKNGRRNAGRSFAPCVVWKASCVRRRNPPAKRRTHLAGQSRLAQRRQDAGVRSKGRSPHRTRATSHSPQFRDTRRSGRPGRHHAPRDAKGRRQGRQR